MELDGWVGWMVEVEDFFGMKNDGDFLFVFFGFGIVVNYNSMLVNHEFVSF